MADTTFIDQQTVIAASWLNDVNDAVYSQLAGTPINVFSYLTDAQKASVLAYNFAVDVATAVQSALDDGWAARRDVFAPGGGYNTTSATLVLPGTRPTPETRDRAIRFYGQGYGNPFSNNNTGGTVFRSTANQPVLQDNPIPTLPDINGVVSGAPTVSPDAQGTVTIDHLRFDGTTTGPVVLLNSFYGISEMTHFVIRQRGTGDGLYVGYGATGSIHDFYTIGVAATTAGLGAARTGIGFNFPNSYGAGLLTVYKCSSRGWHDAYIIGRDVAYPEAIAAGKNVDAYHCVLRDFEVSTCYNGVLVKTEATNCVVDEGYFEGMEDGVCIQDDGFFNDITHNQIFAGFAKGIVLSAGSGYGGVCARNQIATSTRPNTTLIEANMNLGLGRSVTDNTLVFGASGAGVVGVVGIHILGANPQLNLSGNMFNPKIAWSGGAGTVDILDASTSTLGAGSGVYGFGTAKFSNLQIPMLNQGAISLVKDTTAITAAPAGVVTLSAASVHTITFPGAGTVLSSFTAPNLQGKFFMVRVTNGNCVFTNGAALKMSGGVNFTPGVNGAFVTFYYSGTVAEETARTAY